MCARRADLARLVIPVTVGPSTGELKRKVTLMVHVKSMLSIAAEAAWAFGTSMLAGLQLLN